MTNLTCGGREKGRLWTTIALLSLGIGWAPALGSAQALPPVLGTGAPARHHSLIGVDNPYALFRDVGRPVILDSSPARPKAPVLDHRWQGMIVGAIVFGALGASFTGAVCKGSDSGGCGSMALRGGLIGAFGGGILGGLIGGAIPKGAPKAKGEAVPPDSLR